MKEDFNLPMDDAAIYGNEKLPENFEQAANMLIQEGNGLMVKNHGPEGDEKIYHTLENHIEPLQRRGKEIAHILGLSARQQDLIAIFFSHHDTTIEYDAPDPENIVGMVTRHRGAREGDGKWGSEGNEALSAKNMIEAMKRVNKKMGKTLFTEEDMMIGKWAVDTTYPAVDFGKNFEGAEFTQEPLYEKIVIRNPEIAEIIAYLNEQGITKGPHFFQPHLENPLKEGEKIPEEVLVVAMVDLGGVGIIKNPEQFFIEGDNEGRELYHNLRKSENIERLLAGDTKKDREDRAKASQAVLGWMHSQPGFAMWQMIRAEKIIYWLHENGQFDDEREQKFRAFFGNYKSNIKAATERDVKIKKEYVMIQSEQGDKAAFAYLAREMKLKI